MKMVCVRAGDNEESHKGKNYKYEKKTTRVYKTSSKKIQCLFRIVFKRHHETHIWSLYSIPDGRHNHPPPKCLLGHPAYARFKPHQMEKVRQMKGCRPLKILNAIRAEDKTNLSTISTIYAAKATIKRTEWDGRLIMEQSEWLAEKLNYAMQTKVGPGDKVTHVFLAHPRMVDLAQCFYQVLFIDCTYKTNRYNMPMLNVVSHTSDKQSFTVAWCFIEKEEIEDYVWALEQMRLIYRGEESPQVIFTDRDFAVMSIVRQVFLLSQHFLCTWRIQTNFLSKCKNHIQKIKPAKGNQRSKEEDECLSQLSKKETAKEKRKKEKKNMMKRGIYGRISAKIGTIWLIRRP
ncbi:protein FAR-RED ELONGATED HYPOCOTYL 3-like [Papaver somniferum]|uniref:protein FAR-RED ELONGATED HYPOCOTYL 3-like n=1 Tax=Papaver somniferum TaxID=3469 RepID=UPI000E6F6F63|nr:protein FAR-RED ELONGATED HYPOCOTYL 3-like [Papaver somniferum]